MKSRFQEREDGVHTKSNPPPLREIENMTNVSRHGEIPTNVRKGTWSRDRIQIWIVDSSMSKKEHLLDFEFPRSYGEIILEKLNLLEIKPKTCETVFQYLCTCYGLKSEVY